MKLVFMLDNLMPLSVYKYLVHRDKMWALFLNYEISENEFIKSTGDIKWYNSHEGKQSRWRDKKYNQFN